MTRGSEHWSGDEEFEQGSSPASEPSDPGATRAGSAGAAPGDDPAEPNDGADDLEGLSTLDEMIGDDITRLAAERDEYLDSLLRLQADFDNYRKRASRQQADLSERASEKVIVALLPVLDALDLAQGHASTESGSDADALTQISMLLREALRREGLERIDATGVVFDPNVHDAVAHEPASEGDDDDAGEAAQGPEISDVLRAGYTLKGRVLRPAMVKVKG